MRVLHLNNPAQVASNLVLAQRALGIESNLVVTGNKGLHGNYDYDLSDIDTNFVQGKLETGKRLYNLIKDCDILHYHGQAVSKGYRDLVMWSGIMNKPVILHHHGSEIRNKEYPRFANQLVKHRFVSTPDLLQFVPDAEWLPNPVNLDKIKYSKPKIEGKLRILHASNNRKIKNTQTIVEVINKLEKDGLEIDFTLAENLEHERLMELIGENALIIDWLNPNFGIYGVFSIEAMASGRAVICTLTDTLYEKYDLPIINCSPHELSSTIRDIYSDREHLVDKGKSGYDFVHKCHDSVGIAKKVIKKYESILVGKND